MNAAQAEAVMVAVMEAASKGLVPSDLLGKITALQSDQEFIASTTKSTADNDAVQQRLAKAKEYLIDHG